MLVRHAPDSAPKAFSNYSPAVEAPAGARWLYVSGQVGVTTDGTLVADPRGQIEQSLRNVQALLEAAGMGWQDTVRLNIYLTEAADVPLFREARDLVLAGATPASTMVLVAGLAHPDWRVEVEAVAAKA